MSDPKLQELINRNTETSGSAAAQQRAAEQSLPAAKKYADQIVGSQMNDRTSPRK